jgi:hypothetical protein
VITVVGLDKDGVYLEDVRISIPHRVAVTIPPQFIKSRELADAINQRRVFQLQGSLPPGAVFRGTGAVPRAGAPAPAPVHRPVHNTPDSESPSLKTENAKLQQELAEQKALNLGLQTTLAAMSGQLTAIQGVLEDLKERGISVQTVSGGLPIGPKTDVEDDVPFFIPSVKRDDVSARFTVQGQESGTDLDASKNALKALRKKGKQP